MMEDSAIVELYWRRDNQAIDQTEKKYGSYCRNLAYGVLANREDSEECVNDTWLRAWNSMPDKRPDRLSAFLGRITRNLALNRLRDSNRQKRGGGQAELVLDELENCVSGGPDPEREAELTELRAAINTFLGGLKDTERDLFVCRYWYMATVEEIARRFGMGESRVKTSLYRTRLKLRDYLLKEGLA